MDIHEVALTYDTGFEWWLNLLGHQLVPVDVSSKEWMLLDLVSAMVTQPPLRVPLQQSSHHTPRFSRDVRREVEGIREDSLVHDVHVLVIEWRQAGHHLIDQHAESPPVNGLGIPLTLEELGGDVFRCATESFGRKVQSALDCE